jgi:predicted nucleic acid-binding protein
MRLIDTSAWIEWLTASATGKAVEALIPPRGDWLVPTIIQLELAKWLTREVGEDEADQVTAFTAMCVVAPLDTKTALRAAQICLTRKLATADAIVYATMVEHGADLVTCDAHFDGLPNVRFIPKSGA